LGLDFLAEALDLVVGGETSEALGATMFSPSRMITTTFMP
jgi:hypothetical protein